MIPEMELDFAPDELVIDNFAGGGGASTAIEAALGRPIDYAINHNPKALAMHAANHPRTVHLCEDVWNVDILKLVAGRKVGLAWFSPDCRHHSKAKGGKPVEKKIRGLAWVVLRWAGLVKPRVIGLENVEEFQQWGMVHRRPSSPRDRRKCKLCGGRYDGRPCPKHKGVTFKRWKTQLSNLGYDLEHGEVVACKHGAPTIRKRLFLIGRCDGRPIAWPEPTHGPGLLPYRTAAECIDFSIPCPSIFLSKPEAKELGVIRPLADKTLARIAKGVQRFVLGKRKPFLVRVAHGEKDRSGKKRGRGDQDASEPLPTILATQDFAAVVPTLVGVGGRAGQSRPRGGDEPGATITSKADTSLVSAFLARYNGENRPDGHRPGQSPDEPLPVIPTENRFANVQVELAPFTVGAGGPAYSAKPRAVDEPGHAQTAENHKAVATVFLERQFGNSIGSPADQPVGTIMPKGDGKTAAVAAHVVKHFGGMVGTEASNPFPTITGRGTQNQIVTSHILKMKGDNVGHSLDEPLHTLQAQGTHFAEVRCFLKKFLGEDVEPVVKIDGELWIIVDIGMRMLTPRELFRCQGFPDSYIIDRGIDIYWGERVFRKPDAQWITLTKTDQTHMCGNSVSPPPCEALIRAQFWRPRASGRKAA